MHTLYKEKEPRNLVNNGFPGFTLVIIAVISVVIQ